MIDLDAACSVPALLLRLAERHGEHFRAMLLDGSGRLQPGILLFVGEEQVSGDAPRTLQDGDEVTILSPMAGGERDTASGYGTT